MINTVMLTGKFAGIYSDNTIRIHVKNDERVDTIEIVFNADMMEHIKKYVHDEDLMAVKCHVETIYKDSQYTGMKLVAEKVSFLAVKSGE